MPAEYMTQALHLKLGLVCEAMLDALDDIEACRPRLVRGDVGGGQAATRDAGSCSR